MYRFTKLSKIQQFEVDLKRVFNYIRKVMSSR